MRVHCDRVQKNNRLNNSTFRAKGTDQSIGLPCPHDMLASAMPLPTFKMIEIGMNTDLL